MRAFFAGLGIGALIGIAIAPRAGEETRRELLDRAREGWSEAGDKLDDLRERAGKAASRTVHKAQRTYESIAKAGLLEILNDWPEERLIEIDGIGPVLAGKIIQHRPYKQASDLLDSKILPPSAIAAIRKAS